MSTIRVQPAARLRRDFAVWATAQAPKIRTVAPNTFAVPADLFVDVPEDILIGALVDGHRFVSPTEDAANGTPPPAATEWTPPVLPEQEAVPGEPLPELPESAYGPDAVPLDLPAGEEQADSDPSDSSPDTGDGYACDDCGRPYATERGLATHRRTKHLEGA